MATTYRVMDTDVQVPMHIASAVAGLTVHGADADAIAAELPADLEPVRLPGGRGLVLLLAVDYRDNPLGSYDEVAVGYAARPAGGPLSGALDIARGRIGAWIAHMPVSEPFTRAAGEAIWGYPKTVDDLTFDHGGPRGTCTWRRDGDLVLRMSLPTRGALPTPPLPVSTYTRIDGVTMRTRLRATARGVGLRRHDVMVELGPHPVADGLRALDLGPPRAAAWFPRLAMDFTTPRPLDGS